jgi:hypothetical protein
MRRYVLATIMSALIASHACAEKLPNFIKLTCDIHNPTTKENKRTEFTVPDASIGRLHVNEYHIIDIQDVLVEGTDEIIKIYNRRNGDYKVVSVLTDGQVFLLESGKCHTEGGAFSF